LVGELVVVVVGAIIQHIPENKSKREIRENSTIEQHIEPRMRTKKINAKINEIHERKTN
jgi:hypothetical protein